MREPNLHFAIIHIMAKILAWPMNSIENAMNIRSICRPLPLLVGRDSGELDGVSLGPRLEVGAGVLESAEQTLLGVDGLGSVDRVEVLDQSHLVASGRSLASDDGRVGKEELPDLKDRVSREHLTIRRMDLKLTRNHLLPYLATTFSRLAIQLRYHLQRVAE